MSRRKPPNNLTLRKPKRDRALEQNLLPQGQFFIYQTFIPSSKKNTNNETFIYKLDQVNCAKVKYSHY